MVGIDVLGGIARLLEIMLAGAGLQTRHGPGLAVRVNRRATRGGEHKSDPRDARVIADLVRTGRHNAAVLDWLTQDAVLAATEQRNQRVQIPGETVAAALVEDLATDLLDLRLQRDLTSPTYHDRKRAGGKTHHKAVIALSRR